MIPKHLSWHEKRQNLKDALSDSKHYDLNDNIDVYSNYI